MLAVTQSPTQTPQNPVLSELSVTVVPARLRTLSHVDTAEVIHIALADRSIPVDDQEFNFGNMRIAFDVNGIQFWNYESSADLASYEEVSRLILLDPESLPAITLSDIDAIENKLNEGRPLSKEERGLYRRIYQKYTQEVIPTDLAVRLGAGRRVLGRASPFADVVLARATDDVSYEIKLVPSFSKYLDLSDLQRRSFEIERLARTITQFPDTAVLFIPLINVAPEAFARMLMDFESLGLPPDRALVMHGQLLRMAGFGGFREIHGDGYQTRIEPLRTNRNKAIAFVLANTFERYGHEVFDKLTPNNAAYLGATGIARLMHEIRFWKDWPGSALGPDATHLVLPAEW